MIEYQVIQGPSKFEISCCFFTKATRSPTAPFVLRGGPVRPNGHPIWTYVAILTGIERVPGSDGWLIKGRLKEVDDREESFVPFIVSYSDDDCFGPLMVTR